MVPDVPPAETQLQLGVFFSRGCPLKCKFCGLGALSGRRMVQYPLAMGQRMIQALVDRWHPSLIRIEDETLNLDRDRFRDVLEVLASLAGRHCYRIKCRIDRLAVDDITAMQRARVKTIHCGVESASPELLHKIGKVASVQEGTILLESARVAAKRARAAGILMNPVFLLGLPGETRETLDRTAELAFEFGALGNSMPYLSFLTPHPGSYLSAHMNELGLRRISDDLDYYTHKWPVSVPDSLGPDGLSALVEAYNRISTTTRSERYNPPIHNSSVIGIVAGGTSREPY